MLLEANKRCIEPKTIMKNDKGHVFFFSARCASYCLVKSTTKEMNHSEHKLHVTMMKAAIETLQTELPFSHFGRLLRVLKRFESGGMSREEAKDQLEYFDSVAAGGCDGSGGGAAAVGWVAAAAGWAAVGGAGGVLVVCWGWWCWWWCW